VASPKVHVEGAVKNKKKNAKRMMRYDEGKNGNWI